MIILKPLEKSDAAKLFLEQTDEIQPEELFDLIKQDKNYPLTKLKLLRSANSID